MKITKSPMARLMVATATVLLVFPIPANACDMFRRVRNRNCQRVRICQPVRVCQPLCQPNQGAVIISSSPGVIVPQNAGVVEIPSVITPTGQAPPTPQVDEAAPNSGPPAPGAGFSLDTVKSSAIEHTHPPTPVDDTNTIRTILISRQAGPINFQLASPNGPSRFSLLNLNRTSAVKASQEDTPRSRPVISLLNLGKTPQVKAQEETAGGPPAGPPPTAATPPVPVAEPPVAAEAFILANNEPAANVANDDNPYPTPQTSIGGADIEYKIGDLIELWVKPLEVEPEDLESVSYTWTILPVVPTRIWPDNTRVLFGTGATNTTYVVILNASYVFAEKDVDGKIDQIFQRTAVSMASVKVGAGSTPNPTDPVPTDPSLTGLARMAYDWTNGVQRTNSYTNGDVKGDSLKLAASFRLVASQIQNGTLGDVSSILKKTKESNDAAIENRAGWLPWFTKMSEHLQKSYNDGSIKSLDQFQAAWLEIANGLEAASR